MKSLFAVTYIYMTVKTFTIHSIHFLAETYNVIQCSSFIEDIINDIQYCINGY